LSSFSDFALLPALQKALTGEGYTTPTPIQAQTLPPALEGGDVLGIAQTGTGKTAAFALPILNRIGNNPKPRRPRSCRALILSPTRELASQIATSFRTYGKFMPVTTEVVFGGVSVSAQIKRLSAGVDVLVATPGRLLDLISQKALTLDGIEVFVLDEADQMLDLGFMVAIKRIVPMLPKKRQSLFFSATMPNAISSLADNLLHNPAKVSVTPVATTAERVVQGVMHVQASHKQALLAAILKNPAITRVLVFTRTKHGADRVVRQLGPAGIEAAAIHGNKSQAQRERALNSFRKGTTRVLVATDIAARGIDVQGVSHVVNFELPNVPESYVHRIGRTARAGAEGVAISFCASDERPFLRDIERVTRQSVPVLSLPEGFTPPTQSEAAAAAAAEKSARGPQGQRPQQHRRPAPKGQGEAARSPYKPRDGQRTDKPRDGQRTDKPRDGQRSEGQRSDNGRTDGQQLGKQFAGQWRRKERRA